MRETTNVALAVNSFPTSRRGVSLTIDPVRPSYRGVCVCGDPLGQAMKVVKGIKYCSPVCERIDKEFGRRGRSFKAATK